MNLTKSMMSAKTGDDHYIALGIAFGSIAGLFAGIFWFPMELALLMGTAIGLIVGSAMNSLKTRSRKR